MGPHIEPVPSDETLPAKTEVVIVGGGIIGATAALYLAQQGVDVVVCEKGEIAAEQSSRNWGWCRKMVRDPREIRLVIEALRLWGEMNETVEEETGYRTCGIAYLGADQAALERLGGWLDVAREYQLDTLLIDGAEVAQGHRCRNSAAASRPRFTRRATAGPNRSSRARRSPARRGAGARRFSPIAPCAASIGRPDESPGS